MADKLRHSGGATVAAARNNRSRSGSGHAVRAMPNRGIRRRLVSVWVIPRNGPAQDEAVPCCGR